MITEIKDLRKEKYKNQIEQFNAIIDVCKKLERYLIEIEPQTDIFIEFTNRINVINRESTDYIKFVIDGLKGITDIEDKLDGLFISCLNIQLALNDMIEGVDE